jgi:hypothetical protein
LDAINACSSDREALIKHGRDIKDAMSILAIRSLKSNNYDYSGIKYDDVDYDEIELDINEKPWFKEVTKLNDIQPNGRHVYWFYDKIGGCGKSMLAKYMFHTFDGKWIILNSLKSESRLYKILRTNLQCGWECHGVIADLTRFESKPNSIYNNIERIKDGILKKSKNSAIEIEFDVPHLVIFSNKLPKVEYLSRDRWRIYEVKNDEAYLMSEEELNEYY